MNELMTEYAEKALTWLESGANWVAGEIPIYIEELLRWKVAESIVNVSILSILTLTFIFGGVFLIRFGFRIMREEKFKDYYGNDMEVACFMCGAFFSLIHFSWLAVIIHNILVIIQINVTPRVYLMEYLTDIIK